MTLSELRNCNKLHFSGCGSDTNVVLEHFKLRHNVRPFNDFNTCVNLPTLWTCMCVLHRTYELSSSLVCFPCIESVSEQDILTIYLLHMSIISTWSYFDHYLRCLLLPFVEGTWLWYTYINERNCSLFCFAFAEFVFIYGDWYWVE